MQASLRDMASKDAFMIDHGITQLDPVKASDLCLFVITSLFYSVLKQAPLKVA